MGISCKGSTLGCSARRTASATPPPGATTPSAPTSPHPHRDSGSWTARREEAIARLRAWVEHVYQPGYGRLAASLGGCWEQHPLCLYALDWLSELWSVLYLQPRRNAGALAGQAEWQTRLLTAAAEQMAAETSHCEHAIARRSRPVTIGTRR